MQLRRSALRLYFRTARQLGLCHEDPTLDLVLQHDRRKTQQKMLRHRSAAFSLTVHGHLFDTDLDALAD